MEAARDLGRVFGENGWSLVYGGGTVGLMGETAKSCVAHGCDVHGIIPKALMRIERESGVPPQSEYGRTTVVKDMHTRKSAMAKEANAFVALPGGLGTAEELFEIVTWNQLGIHACPIVLLNIGGYYDSLLAWIDQTVTSGFLNEDGRSIISEAKTVEEVAERIKEYVPAAGRYTLNWSKT